MIRQRSLSKLISGFSSARWMDTCDTFNSRPASARVLPACSRSRFARAAKSLFVSHCFLSMKECVQIYIFWLRFLLQRSVNLWYEPVL